MQLGTQSISYLCQHIVAPLTSVKMHETNLSESPTYSIWKKNVYMLFRNV